MAAYIAPSVGNKLNVLDGIYIPIFHTEGLNIYNWRASEASETQFSHVYGISEVYVIRRVKRAPHWGVQSRFRVIYIYNVGMSVVSKKCVGGIT